MMDMRISGSGIANMGMRSTKTRRELHHARMAISCLHDALLAVAQGKLTPEKAREFFWQGESFDRAKMFGDVLQFTDDEATP